MNGQPWTPTFRSGRPGARGGCPESTSTPYVYLTNYSGIGGHHMEADTDRISVEMFSDLLTRLLIADLQGLGMHEPSHAGQEQVIMVE